MEKLKRLLTKLETFDKSEIVNESVEDKEEFITGLVKKRLFERGEDAEGKELKTYKAQAGNVYATYTIIKKEEKGQPTDRVTLKDEGDYYKTFSIKTGKEQFSNVSDDSKPDGKISDNVDISNIMGLNDKELKKMADEILPGIQLKTRKAIFK